MSCYDKGYTDVEVAKVLGLTKKKFLQLYKDSQDFTNFIDKGRTLAEAWWHRNLRENIANKDFNNSLFNFAMKNLYGWADRVESNLTDTDNTANIADLRKQLTGLMGKIEKNNPELYRQIVAQGIH